MSGSGSTGLMEGVLEGVATSLTAATETLESLTGRALDDALRDAERLARQVAAYRTAVVERADRTQRHLDDGHRSVRAWIITVTDTTAHDATVTARTARALRSLPALATAFAAGQVPEASVRQITRRWSNPACADHLPQFDTVLTHWATTMPADEFATLMVEWERRADPDGTHRDRDTAHDQRRAGFRHLGTEVHGFLQCGTYHGAVLEEILDRYERAEFEADLAAARAQHGPGPVPADRLPRTPAQRRFDALYRIFLTADTHGPHPTTQPATHTEPAHQPVAAEPGPEPDPWERTDGDDGGRHTPPGPDPTNDGAQPHPPVPADDEPGPAAAADVAADPTPAEPCPTCHQPPDNQPPTPPPRRLRPREPLVNLVIDWDTYHRELARLGGQPPPHLDPDHIHRWTSRTDRGHPIHPTDILHAILHGHTRLILTTPTGTITHTGPRQRLFRGNQRDAALLQHPQCIWPGCQHPAPRCEADHLHPHTTGGPTTPANGAPMCDHHNRFKHDHHYTTHRTPDGRWHTHRPDGTQLT